MRRGLRLWPNRDLQPTARLNLLSLPFWFLRHVCRTLSLAALIGLFPVAAARYVKHTKKLTYFAENMASAQFKHRSRSGNVDYAGFVFGRDTVVVGLHRDCCKTKQEYSCRPPLRSKTQTLRNDTQKYRFFGETLNRPESELSGEEEMWIT